MQSSARRMVGSEPPNHRKVSKLAQRLNPTEVKLEPYPILSLGSRGSYGALEAVQSGRKRFLFEWEGILDAIDVESSCESRSADELRYYADIVTRSNKRLQPSSEVLKKIAHQLADQTLPSVSQWVASARYIRPPDYRIPARKQRVRSGALPSLLIETEDPADPSTTLILRVDGCFHLACPLFVSSPFRYESCLRKHSIRSIEDLFNHLKTHHPHPIYCPVCGQFFDDEFVRDRHIRALSCAHRNFSIEKGVTRTQLAKMMDKDDRNRREEERWQRIYQVLFPGGETPRTEMAYLEHGPPLALSMVRDYWDSHGRRVVNNYLQVRALASGQSLDKQAVSVLFELVGSHLVRRVAEDALRGQNCLLERTEDVAEEEWETIKPEQD
ncbi:hypothetical protein QBC34DRAFT_397784 [Podospora aff. communis PSN243]|uniref:C2H2-type domain-containing protein n=1 Tax=Podospora aff. communis PSN243 TaxID=3040156 RepID=A0AAV9GXX5_9PEZI|nr:hypothetical protein QBC34DRAFT_397784 [Podospora aff. communis PSN243]